MTYGRVPIDACAGGSRARWRVDVRAREPCPQPGQALACARAGLQQPLRAWYHAWRKGTESGGASGGGVCGGGGARRSLHIDAAQEDAFHRFGDLLLLLALAGRRRQLLVLDVAEAPRPARCLTRRCFFFCSAARAPTRAVYFDDEAIVRSVAWCTPQRRQAIVRGPTHSWVVDKDDVLTKSCARIDVRKNFACIHVNGSGIHPLQLLQQLSKTVYLHQLFVCTPLAYSSCAEEHRVALHDDCGPPSLGRPLGQMNAVGNGY
eukprot:gene1819-biopygen16872